ncbi:uncharacterized protein PRCAT00005417001 [Priceomyces carsonii]|uniref:uncharacterized protein n=1 Tax=Priceomyces carsonii TaxID=28549 RepID=UPI002ED87C53|nr:unnamed protein product [Priceomyces carsonii]
MGLCLSKQSSELNEAPKSGKESTSGETTTQTKRQNQKHALTSSNNNSLASNNLKQNTLESTASTNQDNVVPNGSASNTDKEVKVLLLGSGESGKSTIVKQMKILHQNGYTKEERYEYKPFVYKNILTCIKNIINAITDLEPDLIHDSHSRKENSIKDEEDSLEDFKGEKPNEKHVLNYEDMNEVLDYDISIDSEEQFSPKIAGIIDHIYKVQEVQNFIKYQQGNFYFVDSSDYFLSDVKRFAQPDYIPTVNDILRTRKKTSGIFDFRFQMSGLNIHMYDVGGQRSERRKWIHCFDNVTLIIFCVALSEYDQVLLEENNQNRLEESLALFDSVVNSRWFSRTSIVLFLNKIDVFSKKLPYSPLENHFPDYTGGDNINKAAKYILWRFTQLNRSGLSIYPHVTQATDTSNIQLVFAAVRESILENALKNTGIL